MNPKDMTNEQVIIGLSDALRVEINHLNKPDDRIYALNYRQTMESELLRRLYEADALRKENEELRKDKERLDWLDGQSFNFRLPLGGNETLVICGQGDVRCGLTYGIRRSAELKAKESEVQS